jgi:hypothetical protein
LEIAEVTTTETPPETTNTPTDAESKPAKSKRGGRRPNQTGRPRKHPLPAQVSNGSLKILTRETNPDSRKLILPAPPKQWFNKPQEFFEYWASIKEPDLQGRIGVYVYRDWPVCDLRKFDIPGGKKSPVNIDKIEGACPVDPDHWKDDILRLWGSGDYHMMFNELATNRARCVSISVRDMINFPPVLDYTYLSESDPLNKDFVRWARSTGRLKSEGEQREDDDMAANAESTLHLTETIKDLTREVIDARSTPPPTPAPVINENSRAALTGMDMLKDTMTTALGMVKNLAEERTNAVTDPVESLDKVLTVIERINPSKKDDGTQALMMKMIEDAQRREEAAQRRAEKLEERIIAMQTAQHAPPAPPKSLAEQLTEMRGLKESFGEFFGGGTAAASDDSPRVKQGTLGMIMDALPSLFEHGATIMGHATRMMQMSKAAAPLQQPQQPSATARAYQPPTVVNDPYAHLPPGMRPTAGAPVTPPTQPPATTQPNVIEMPQQPEIVSDPGNPYMQFLQEITPAFVNHVQQRLPGDAFAEWLVNSRPDGKMIYAQIVDAGTENLIGMLQQYPPIWSVAGTVPKFFAKFVDEFMAYGNEEEGEDDNAAGA